MAKHLPTGTVSFLFTDIQGSTELLHHLGDQRYGEVLLEHQRILREAFAREDGAEVDTQGDAFFVAFPRAWNAVAAATTAQHALAATPWPEGVTVRVRMGIHTGEPTLVGDHYVGLDVHRAARIAATGYGGQVLLSERSQAMAQGSMPAGVEVRDLGEHRLKDLHRPEHIYQLVIPPLPADFPPLKSLEVLVTNLPALQLTSFVGRAREMGEIKTRLAATRLLTLLGPGGTGKTRLALQVGSDLLEQFPKGVWLVELAPLSDPGLVIQTVATVFNVREAAGRPLLDSLIDYLKPRELLLVLDNCEHLIESSAHLTGALLRGCPQLRIMATSREPLGVPGEATYRVPPLSRPDPTKVTTAQQLGEFEAAQLFIERALLSNPQFAVTDRVAPAVARVVHRLDGIPLAVELAAARTKVLSVDQIAARLDDRFRLLTVGARTGPQHHQTLRATIDWSHDLLSVPERTLFRHLSVFAGGFSLEAAEAICAGGEIDAMDVLDLLARLVDKSLVITEELDGDVRYRMLETIREYGREKLEDSGDASGVRRRHLQWYLGLTEEGESKLRGPDQLVWLDRLELEHDNLRAALDMATLPETDVEVGLQLAGGLHRFWLMHGYLSEGRTRLAAALKRGETQSALRARALYAAGAIAHRQGDYEAADLYFQSSLSLARQLEDGVVVTLTLNNLGRLARHRGDFRQATQFGEESAALSRTLGLMWALAEALNVLGLAARSLGDYQQARTFLEEGLALWRNLGDKWGLAEGLATLGVVAFFEGDYERARALHEEALALRREMNDRLNLPISLIATGNVALARKDYQRAAHLYEESLVLSREIGTKMAIATSLANSGMTANWQGEHKKALPLLEEARTIFAEMGAKLDVGMCLNAMAMAWRGLGEHSRSAELYRQAVKIFHELGDKTWIAEGLAGLAKVATAQNRLERSARLFGAAERLREAIGYSPLPADNEDLESAIQALKGAYDQTQFTRAWRKGREMELEEAVHEALDTGSDSIRPPGGEAS